MPEQPNIQQAQSAEAAHGRRWPLVVGAGALIAGAAAVGALRGNDGNAAVNPGIEASTSVDSTTTTLGPDAANEVDNLLNPSAQELAQFSCSDPSLAKYGVVAVKVNNESFIQQILPQRIPVEVTAKDVNHRIWSDSLDAPFTEPNTDKEAQEKELDARFCANPGLLAATVDFVTKTKIPGSEELLGQHSEMLKQFVDMSSDDVSKFFTNPYNQDKLTQDQLDKNLEVTKTREEYAALMAIILNGMQNNGVIKNVNLHSDYSLSPESLVNPLDAAKFKAADYKGDALTFGFTLKDQDCELFAFGFNAGANNIDGGDKRPVIVITRKPCAPTVTTTTVHHGGTTTTTTPHGSTTTTVPNQTTSTRPEVAVPTQSSVIAGPGAGGTPDTDNNPNNNVTTSNVSTTTNPNQQPGTTVTVPNTAPNSSVLIP